MIDIRPAAVADVAALAELRWEFRSPRAPQLESHDAFVARCADWMRSELGAGAWRAWLAHDGERVGGQIWMHLIDKIPNPAAEHERHAYISNVYVTPEWRGGVGDRLLSAALAQAATDRVDRVVLWPTERSRSLYMRHGFRPNGDLFELIFPVAPVAPVRPSCEGGPR